MSAGAGRRAPRRWQRGMASVEFAICTGLIFALLPQALLFGRTLMYYSVLLDATRAAAQSLALAPPTDMGATDGRAAAIAAARQIVLDAALGAHLGLVVTQNNVSVLCGAVACDSNLEPPGLIRVTLIVTPPNDLLRRFLVDVRPGGFRLVLESAVQYAQ